MVSSILNLQHCWFQTALIDTDTEFYCTLAVAAE